MPRYQIVFEGTIAPGHSVDQVKQRLCRLFRKDHSTIDTLFSGGPVAIRKNIDLPTADRFKSVMEQAGAICRIETVHPAGTDSGVAASKITQKKADDTSLLVPRKCSALLRYAPLTCPEITAWEKGINLNRKDRQKIAYTAIRMVSIFEDGTDTAHPLKFMFYLHDLPRPLYAKAETIRFNDFPGGRGTSLVESLRIFLKNLIRHHPGLILDVETHRFLQKGRPQVIDRGMDAFATSLGLALETQIRSKAVKKMTPGAAGSTVLPDTVSAQAPPAAGSAQAALTGRVAIRQYQQEPDPEQRQALRSRHRRKAVIFLVLSVFFGLGFVGTTSNLIQEMNRGTSQPAFFSNISARTPEMKRQLELLEYNRKMNKVTTTLSLVICFALALFFFSKSQHHFQQTRK